MSLAPRARGARELESRRAEPVAGLWRGARTLHRPPPPCPPRPHLSVLEAQQSTLSIRVSRVSLESPLSSSSCSSRRLCASSSSLLPPPPRRPLLVGGVAGGLGTPLCTQPGAALGQRGRRLRRAGPRGTRTGRVSLSSPRPPTRASVLGPQLGRRPSAAGPDAVMRRRAEGEQVGPASVGRRRGSILSVAAA